MPDPRRRCPLEDARFVAVLAELQQLATCLASAEPNADAALTGDRQSSTGRSDLARRWQGLTPRERLALELLHQGQSYKQIALAWSVQSGTVRAHTCRALRKLGLATRREWLEVPVQ